MINDAISHKFKKHVRGMFDPSLLKKFRDEIEKLYRRETDHVSTDREVKAIARGETPDSIRLNTLWYSAWLGLSNQSLEEIRPFTWLYYPPQVRRIREQIHEVPWHQDLGFVRAMPSEKQHRQIITCFVPIDDEPSECVTLEFSESTPDYLPHSETYNGFSAGLNIDFDKTFHYKMDLGDCAIFGDLAPHRTFAPEGTKWERTSFEFRLINPDDALRGKDYFDVEAGKFVQFGGDSSLRLP